jgi:hypothetical protein
MKLHVPLGLRMKLHVPLGLELTITGLTNIYVEYFALKHWFYGAFNDGGNPTAA